MCCFFIICTFLISFLLQICLFKKSFLFLYTGEKMRMKSAAGIFSLSLDIVCLLRTCCRRRVESLGFCSHSGRDSFLLSGIVRVCAIHQEKWEKKIKANIKKRRERKGNNGREISVANRLVKRRKTMYYKKKTAQQMVVFIFCCAQFSLLIFSFWISLNFIGKAETLNEFSPWELFSSFPSLFYKYNEEKYIYVYCITHTLSDVVTFDRLTFRSRKRKHNTRIFIPV